MVLRCKPYPACWEPSFGALGLLCAWPAAAATVTVGSETRCLSSEPSSGFPLSAFFKPGILMAEPLRLIH